MKIVNHPPGRQFMQITVRGDDKSDSNSGCHDNNSCIAQGADGSSEDSALGWLRLGRGLAEGGDLPAAQAALSEVSERFFAPFSVRIHTVSV